MGSYNFFVLFIVPLACFLFLITVVLLEHSKMSVAHGAGAGGYTKVGSKKTRAQVSAAVAKKEKRGLVTTWRRPKKGIICLCYHLLSMSSFLFFVRRTQG